MRIKLFESYNEYAKLLSIKPQIEDILIDLGDYDDVEYNIELNGDKEDCELRLDVKLYNIEYISGVMNILNRVAKLLDEEELINL